jgi:glycerophosphoryl diester phosphodiesterase
MIRKKSIQIILGALALGAFSYAALRRSSKRRPNHPFLAVEKPLVMAHRGGQGLWPPNTLYAFQRAVSLGVDILELDIHSTADGVIVVRHDPFVDSTTNGSGFIRDLQLSELKELDAGYQWTADGGKTYPFRGKGISIPTLEEILIAFPEMRLNIDIKPEDPSIIAPFCSLLQKYNALERTLIGSFHDSQLARFREICPGIATAAGVSETRLFFGLSRMFLGDVYQPKAEAFQIPENASGLNLVTPQFVRSAHRRNMQVHVWTVNSPNDMERLLAWGVDGIITDYPDLALKFRDR